MSDGTLESAATSASVEQRNIYLTLTFIIQALVVTGLVLFVLKRDWENVFLSSIVLLLTLSPTLLYRKWGVFVPPEFQLVAVAFIFLSLYLGSARDFYYKYWWWDLVLHTSSGFLLGIVGFIALFMLNRSRAIPQGLKPAFVCFFAVTFAVFLGVVWEIFEFAVDSVSPAQNMQSRETGVTDTMQDLIVDTIGATIVAVMGYAYARSGRYSFIADGVGAFVRRNPKLFGGKARGDR